ncbi:MAG: PIN domain-containing protein, partial [Oscillospiraceae bacterium]|nr:PIN domain-containing protein [Oscillospiraceae bacterium]
VDLSSEATNRADHFRINGIGDFDSLHLAVAEKGDVDAFLTTDDRLLKAAHKLNLKIKVANPVAWLMEVLSNESNDD